MTGRFNNTFKGGNIMKQNIVDARGMTCPKPVVMTRDALAAGTESELIVLVDNAAARDNVARFAGSQGCTASVEENPEGTFRVCITASGNKTADLPELKSCALPSSKTNTVVFINSDTIGRGNDELGTALMKAFSFALAESSNLPATLVFMNSGVKLTVEGSDALENLKKIDTTDTSIMVCGTCLDYYGITDKLGVGIVSNMYDIVEAFLAADKVITL